MDVADTLLRAARRKVTAPPGSSQLSRDTIILLSICWRKNVILGLSVNTKLAEYPAHNPSTPFSRLISATVSLNVVLRADPFPRRLAVCCLVTTLLTGVVNAFEHAPVAAPTASSSQTLRYRASCARSRLARNHCKQMSASGLCSAHNPQTYRIK